MDRVDNTDPCRRGLLAYIASQERVVCAAYPLVQGRLLPETYGEQELQDCSRSIAWLTGRPHVQELLATILALHAANRHGLYALPDDCIYYLVHLFGWVCITCSWRLQVENHANH